MRSVVLSVVRCVLVCAALSGAVGAQQPTQELPKGMFPGGAPGNVDQRDDNDRHIRAMSLRLRHPGQVIEQQSRPKGPSKNRCTIRSGG